MMLPSTQSWAYPQTELGMVTHIGNLDIALLFASSAGREEHMCPVCITTAALIASSATSVGGLAALVVKKLSAKSEVKPIPNQIQLKENHDGQ